MLIIVLVMYTTGNKYKVIDTDPNNEGLYRFIREEVAPWNGKDSFKKVWVQEDNKPVVYYSINDVISRRTYTEEEVVDAETNPETTLRYLRQVIVELNALADRIPAFAK